MCCTVPNCTVLRCTVLNCTVLYCTVLQVYNTAPMWHAYSHCTGRLLFECTAALDVKFDVCFDLQDAIDRIEEKLSEYKRSMHASQLEVLSLNSRLDTLVISEESCRLEAKTGREELKKVSAEGLTGPLWMDVWADEWMDS